MKLTTDLIYEAALDDQLFHELPTLLAASVDARSCVLHWRDQSGDAQIFAHSAYFSDEQMADYATNFTGHDLWTEAGMRQGKINQAWKTSDLVAPGAYDDSIFYNEWIRPMGDDTYHCCGSVMRTVHGDGIVGLHRGRGQADFSDRIVDDLNGKVDHLRRMFGIRGRIASLEDRANLLDALFACGAQPALLVSPNGRVARANAAGEALLCAGHFLRLRSGRLVARTTSAQGSFDAALARACSTEDRRASTLLLSAGEGRDVAVASVTPVLGALREACAMVTIDQRGAPLPAQVVASHLREEYKLSAAEVDVALRLARGATLREIGDARGAALGTVRFQVKNVLSKMDVRRQGEVVRLIGAIGTPRTDAPLQ